MEQSTAAVRPITASLELSLNLTMGANNGLSQIEIIVEAITNHRDYYFKKMFDEIKGHEYENAYSHYQNFKDLSYLLDQLLLDVTDLAYTNYGAATYKGNVQAQAKQAESVNKRRLEGYDKFLDLITSRTSDEIE